MPEIIPAQVHRQPVVRGYSRLRHFTVEEWIDLHSWDIPLALPTYWPESFAGMDWDVLADDFALSAFTVGFSANRIWQRLLQKKYIMSLAQVVWSLQAHDI